MSLMQCSVLDSKEDIPCVPVWALASRDSQNRVQATETCRLLPALRSKPMALLQFSFPESCNFRNMLVLGEASSLLCFLFMHKRFCRGSFMPNKLLPFPCVPHGSTSALLSPGAAREGSSPERHRAVADPCAGHTWLCPSAEKWASATVLA